MPLKNVIMVIVYCLVINLSHHPTSASIFTSMKKLQRLPVVEWRMLSHFDEYLDLIWYDVYGDYATYTADQVSLLDKFISRTRKDLLNITATPTLMTNPLVSYRVLRRMVVDWREIFHVASNCTLCRVKNACENFREAALRQFYGPLWPTEDDLKGATISLARLIFTYHLNDVFNGAIHDNVTSPLYAYDASMMAQHIVEFNPMEAALLYRHSLKMLRNENEFSLDGLGINLSCKFNAKSIYKLMYFAYVQFSRRDTVQALQEAILHFPEDVWFRRKLVQTQVFQYPNPQYWLGCTENGMDLYRALCHQDIRSPEEDSHLRCVYWPTKLRIVWGKAEYVHNKPDIVLFHDVISKKEIDAVMVLAYNAFKRSQIARKVSHTSERVSDTSWIQDMDPLATKVNQRPGIYTGLMYPPTDGPQYSEPLQVVNYGLGGLYQPHVDFLYSDHGYPKERIATWLYTVGPIAAPCILKGAEHGGATVFPHLRLRVKSKTGDAVFWWNLHPSGTGDYRTYHGGCPVLMGTKTIANKWIHLENQFRNSPCPLTRIKRKSHTI